MLPSPSVSILSPSTIEVSLPSTIEVSLAVSSVEIGWSLVGGGESDFSVDSGSG